MIIYYILGEYLEQKGLYKAVLKREKELNENNASNNSEFVELMKQKKASEYLLPQLLLQPNPNLIQPSQPQMESLPSSVEHGIATNLGSDLPSPEKISDRKKRENLPQYLVLVRHGKTEHNRLGLFTGWEDVPLIDAGQSLPHNSAVHSCTHCVWRRILGLTLVYVYGICIEARKEDLLVCPIQGCILKTYAYSRESCICISVAFFGACMCMAEKVYVLVSASHP